jgi:hypothetical protein
MKMLTTWSTNKIRLFFVVFSLASLTQACTSAPGIEQDRQAAKEAPVAPQAERVGFGTVQTINTGDSAQSVVEKLGGPDLVTSRDGGGELWVYEKLSVNYEKESGLRGLFSSVTIVKSEQSSMITTIYLDENGVVEQIKYRSSRY